MKDRLQRRDPEDEGLDPENGPPDQRPLGRIASNGLRKVRQRERTLVT